MGEKIAPPVKYTPLRVDVGHQPIPFHVQKVYLREKNPGVPTSEAERTREFTQTRHADR